MRRIALGGAGSHEALIDDEDYERVARHHWTATRKPSGTYAVRFETRAGRQWVIYLHVEIVSPPAGMEVDHRSGDTLDCRRANLRVATHQQNAANGRARGCSSRFKGVCWDRARGQWVAGIKVNYVRLNLGRFSDESAAARAYDDAARTHFGEFARTNFP